MNNLKCLLLVVSLFVFASCGDDKEEPLPVPSGAVDFTAVADGNEVTLDWESQDAVDIWRAIGGGVDFDKIASSVKESPYVDLVEEASDNDEVAYRIVVAGSGIGSFEVMQKEKTVRIETLTDDELLDLVQSRTLKYFFDFAHPNSGMIRERDTSGDVVTTGGTGFGVMALIAGAERGFISRADAYGQIRKITDFLGRVARFHGAYAHWYNGATGAVQPFSEKDDGGDLVETSLLFQGMLTAKEYFADGSAEEAALAEDIDKLWREIEWTHYLKDGKLMWHWSENYGFEMNLAITGWNEAMITYVLAGCSPTYPIDKSVYFNGFQNGGNMGGNAAYYGYHTLVGDGMDDPLFFAHYSFLGLDPRGLKDEVCADYFQNNKNHTLIHRSYCIENPKGFVGYGAYLWGLTASDCPVEGYMAHSPNSDNGTISPTAALSSMPYTPEESMEVLEHLYRDLGMMGEYGFYDAVNLSVETDKQIVKSFLAIDQGPIVVMIENCRSQLLWNLFMDNPDIRRGLPRLGFSSSQHGI